MYCRNCGKEIYGTKEYCEACQAELDSSSGNTEQQAQQPQVQQSQQSTYNDGGNQKKKCCPRCKSRNLQIVTNTEYHSQTSGGGYSAGKGCCGYMALGPLGLLCGACGSKSKTTVTSNSTNVWVCRDCGNKFRDVADIESDIVSANSKFLQNFFYVVAGICAFMVLIPLIQIFSAILSYGADIVTFFFDFDMILSVIFLIITPIVFIWLGKVMSQARDKRLMALYEEKRNIEQNGYIDE